MLRDQIDPLVATPPVWPFVPQPNALQLATIFRVILENPLSDVFKVPATLSLVALQLRVQFKKTVLTVLPIHHRRFPSVFLGEPKSRLAVQLLKNHLPTRIMVIKCEIRAVIYIFLRHFGNEKYRWCFLGPGNGSKTFEL